MHRKVHCKRSASPWCHVWKSRGQPPLLTARPWTGSDPIGALVSIRVTGRLPRGIASRFRCMPSGLLPVRSPIVSLGASVRSVLECPLRISPSPLPVRKLHAVEHVIAVRLASRGSYPANLTRSDLRNVPSLSLNPCERVARVNALSPY